ncbi:MAG: hypothetical protein GXP35_17675 [Actinobacteria bacterium]|nr:hypothetical protein [Actinomycetota bacterium]
MGALFGTLSALGVGLGDLYGRRVALKSSYITVAASLQFVAIFSSLAAVVFVSSQFTLRDIALGGLSGFGMGAGLVTYFVGLGRAGAAVVGPTVAALMSVIPFVYAASTGATVTSGAAIGAVVALIGLLMVTGGRAKADAVRAGAIWAVAAGCSYGFALTVMITVDSDAGAWPGVSQRIVAFALMVPIAMRANVPLTAPSGLRTKAVLAGIFGGLSTIFYLVGLGFDTTSTVVTAAMFPAVTVVVGRMAFGDAVRPIQILGLGAVLVGVIAVVVA